MKNVANCDTWCELQNPVNHRVFERKLRPKPFGEGTFAWVSHTALPPIPRPESGGQDSGAYVGLPRRLCPGWPKIERWSD